MNCQKPPEQVSTVQGEVFKCLVFSVQQFKTQTYSVYYEIKHVEPVHSGLRDVWLCLCTTWAHLETVSDQREDGK